MKQFFVFALTLLSAICLAARIEQGTTDRYVSFVAVDSVDYVTRETSLTNTAVYYMIDGSGAGTATAMTTPTISAADTANMPGVFWLKIDEVGMVTLTAGVDEEELVLHITADEMAPVTLSIEIFRSTADVVWDEVLTTHTTSNTGGDLIYDLCISWLAGGTNYTQLFTTLPASISASGGEVVNPIGN